MSELNSMSSDHRLMNEYKQELDPIAEALNEARERKSPEAEVQKLEQAKQACELRNLEPIILECAEQGYTLVPLYHHTDPRVSRWAQKILDEQLQMRGKPTWNQPKPNNYIGIAIRLISDLTKPYTKNEYDEAYREEVYTSPDGEQQSRFVLNSVQRPWAPLYTVQCGPRLCGEIVKDGKCSHGLIHSRDAPPEWVDEAGWQNGNPFQLGHEGEWAPKYTFDENMKRSGPHYM